MSDQPKQMTEDEAAEFAEQVFDVARRGDAAMLAALLAKGLPANFRNHNGDTLLMLAAYHGHAEAVKVLLEFKADPLIANDKNQLPIAGAAFKGPFACGPGAHRRRYAGGSGFIRRAHGLDDGGHVQPRRNARLPARPGR